MPPLKVLGLFLGIATIPVIGLARTAAGSTWTAPVSLIQASTMVVLVDGIFFVLAVITRSLWSAHGIRPISAIGWFALVSVNFAGLRPALSSAARGAPWRWMIIVLALGGVAVWIGTRLDPDARFLVTFVPILIAIQGFFLIGDLVRFGEPTPVALVPHDASAGQPPSIWVILLDSHAGPKVLSDLHDIDLSKELAQLETLGFRVWDDARTNYSHTLVSVPSLLSGQIWDPEVVAASYGPMISGVQADTQLVASIKEAGLSIRMIPNNWSRSGCGAIVDDCIGDPLFDERWYYLVRSTPLPDLFPAVFPDPWPSGGLGTLHAIADVDSAARHFTFVHSMASHPPAIIGPACSPASKAELNGSMSAQLRCTHEALFEALGTIDLTSDVVILTADHGYALGDTTAPPEEWSDDLVRTWFSIFTAISTPRNCEETLPDDLSVAQILPLVLNCYGADLPVPTHRFMRVFQSRSGQIGAIELAWDGWSPYKP